MAVRRLDQPAGAGTVHEALSVLRPDPQRRPDVVRPEVRAQRCDQQGVEHRFVQPAQPLDQRELGRLRDRGRRRLPVARGGRGNRRL